LKPVPWFVSCTVAGLTFWGSAWPAAAQTSPFPLVTLAPPSPADAPSLAQAVDAAWQRAVQASEATAQTRRAAAERIAASSFSALPPALEVNHFNDRAQSNAGRRETGVGIAWPLWLPGQRDARLAVAEAEIGLADTGVAAARLRVAGQVRDLAWRTSAAEAEVQALGAEQRYVQGIAEDVQRRVGAGDLARSDALAARGESLEADALQSDAMQRFQALLLQWRTLTGLGALPVLALPSDASIDTSVETTMPVAGHPERRLAAQAVERARRRIDIVTRFRRDAPELSVRYREEIPGLGQGTQRGIGVGLRIPLGTDGRNAPLQAAAAGELEVAEANERRLNDQLDADLQTTRSALVRAARQLETARTRAALLRERAQLIERSFKAGETPLPELLRAVNAAARADAALVRQRAALGLAHAQLQQALGVLP
jgi:outer membrane protein TolC